MLRCFGRPWLERTARVHEVIKRGSWNICRCCVADGLTCLWLELPARMFDRLTVPFARIEGWRLAPLSSAAPTAPTGRLIATPACLHRNRCSPPTLPIVA